MAFNWIDKRQEFRFQLKGSFEGFKFALGAQHFTAEPIDVSRSGIGGRRTCRRSFTTPQHGTYQDLPETDDDKPTPRRIPHGSLPGTSNDQINFDCLATILEPVQELVRENCKQASTAIHGSAGASPVQIVFRQVPINRFLELGHRRVRLVARPER